MASFEPISPIQPTLDYEACDDGNENNQDACLNSCAIARCGDGVVRTDLPQGQLGYEACDDGNGVDTDACRNTCEVASCGDGVVRTDITDPNNADYEACDDGNKAIPMLASTAVWTRIAAMGLNGPMLKNATTAMTTTATPASTHVSSPAAGTAFFEMTSR